MKKTIKKIVITGVYLSLLIGLIVYHEPINNYIIENYIYAKDIQAFEVNKYAKETDYQYLQINNDFTTENINDLQNNIYTIIDSGLDEYTFYCSNKYKECIDDVDDLSNNTAYLTIINNFVHPFNSFNKLYISTNNLGKITIVVDKLYTNNEIDYVNTNLDLIISQIITSDMEDADKIRAFHDYIINTTVYDEERSNEIKRKIYSTNIFNSHKASGVLENHIALCSGYTDIMAVFLNRIGVPNFKISNTDHIWNAVYLNNGWYHLDLTWDDPITKDGSNILITDFFLITDNELLTKETTEHNYDTSIYKEIATNN